MFIISKLKLLKHFNNRNHQKTSKNTLRYFDILYRKKIQVPICTLMIQCTAVIKMMEIRSPTTGMSYNTLMGFFKIQFLQLAIFVFNCLNILPVLFRYMCLMKQRGPPVLIRKSLDFSPMV
jgi:hypothetical protein